VVATASKLRNLKSLRVDTGDPELDRDFRKNKLKVIFDYKSEEEMPVE